MKKVLAIGLVLGLSVYSIAQAVQYTVQQRSFRESNKQLTGLAAHGPGNRGYFRINGTLEGACNHNIIVFEHGTTFGDAAFELLQTAHANNSTLARIDYIEENPAGGHCLLTVLEIN